MCDVFPGNIIRYLGHNNVVLEGGKTGDFPHFYLNFPNVFNALLLLDKYFSVRLSFPPSTPFFSYSCVFTNTKCFPILRELYSIIRLMFFASQSLLM